MGYGWVLCRVGECAGSLGGLYGSGWGCNPKLPTLKFLIPEIPTPDIPITNFPLLKFPPQNSHPKNSHPQNSHLQTRPLPPAQLSQGSLGRITPAPKSLPVLSRAQKPTVTPPAPIPLPTGPAASPRQSIPGTRRDAGDARPWVGQPLDAAIFNAPWGGTAPYPLLNPLPGSGCPDFTRGRDPLLGSAAPNPSPLAFLDALRMQNKKWWGGCCPATDLCNGVLCFPELSLAEPTTTESGVAAMAENGAGGAGWERSLTAVLSLLPAPTCVPWWGWC